MKKVKEIVRAQCDKCGLMTDRRQYVDGTFQEKCPRCGFKGCKIIR